MELPTVVEEMLVDVVADGFVVYCCGPKAAPNALVACYRWDRGAGCPARHRDDAPRQVTRAVNVLTTSGGR
ncbi:MAG: hypothetical protein ACT4NP_15360 [Pseudonocardiales bacterium]